MLAASGTPSDVLQARRWPPLDDRAAQAQSRPAPAALRAKAQAVRQALPAKLPRVDRHHEIEATHCMNHYHTLEELRALVGKVVGVSDWISLEQARIEQFAHATGDHQWIHVDPVRAAAGPFGAPIAHGFLTLSLLPLMGETAFDIGDVRMGVNYGLNRVRFPNPVRVGSRLRGHFKLLAWEPLEGGAQLTTEVTVELEGAAKPACVAESVSRRFI